jgi:hypothetical protein
VGLRRASLLVHERVHRRDGDRLAGRPAGRRGGYGTELGSLLDPTADKILVLAMLVVLVDRGVFADRTVAAIVVREFFVIRAPAGSVGARSGTPRARSRKTEDVGSSDRRGAGRVRRRRHVGESIAW